VFDVRHRWAVHILKTRLRSGADLMHLRRWQT
jgi:hypothetical protein